MKIKRNALPPPVVMALLKQQQKHQTFEANKSQRSKVQARVLEVKPLTKVTGLGADSFVLWNLKASTVVVLSPVASFGGTNSSSGSASIGTRRQGGEDVVEIQPAVTSVSRIFLGANVFWENPKP